MELLGPSRRGMLAEQHQYSHLDIWQNQSCTHLHGIRDTRLEAHRDGHVFLDWHEQSRR
jgi:hypothetical protein